MHWQQTRFYSQVLKERRRSYQTEYTVLVKTTDVNKTNKFNAEAQILLK